MTSIREQIYQVAAADTGIGGVVGMLEDAAAGLRGGESSPPPPAGNAPWAYLRLDAQVPWQPWPERLAPQGTLGGLFQWWLYDDERAGYARLRVIGSRLRLLYGPPRFNETVWLDPATGEDVYALQWAGYSAETADPESGQLLLVANWQYRMAYRRESLIGPAVAGVATRLLVG